MSAESESEHEREQRMRHYLDTVHSIVFPATPAEIAAALETAADVYRDRGLDKSAARIELAAASFSAVGAVHDRREATTA